MGVRVSVAVVVAAGDGSQIVAIERASNVLNPDPRQPDADADLAKEKVEEMLAQIQEEAGGQLDDWKTAIQRITGGLGS